MILLVNFKNDSSVIYDLKMDMEEYRNHNEIDSVSEKYQENFLNIIGKNVPLAELIKEERIAIVPGKNVRICMSLPENEICKFLTVNDVEEFRNLEELHISSSIKEHLIREYFDSSIIKVNRVFLDSYRVLMDIYRMKKDAEVKQQFVLFKIMEKTSALFKEYRPGIPIEKQCLIGDEIIGDLTQIIANDENMVNVLGEKGKVTVLL